MVDDIVADILSLDLNFQSSNIEREELEIERFMFLS